jgi:hypothetical protein
MIPLIASLYFCTRQLSEAISPQAITNCLVFRAALQMPLNGGRCSKDAMHRVSTTQPVRVIVNSPLTGVLEAVYLILKNE